jgi:hypothetical protein
MSQHANPPPLHLLADVSIAYFLCLYVLFFIYNLCPPVKRRLRLSWMTIYCDIYTVFNIPMTHTGIHCGPVLPFQPIFIQHPSPCRAPSRPFP